VLLNTLTRLTTSLETFSTLLSCTPSSSASEGKFTTLHWHQLSLTTRRNTGKTNSFTGVDITNLTGGVFNLETLTKGNNFACFVYQLAAQAKPDILLNALDSLVGAVGKLTGGLSCPQLKSIDVKQLQALPGYKKQAVYG
jgi:hypothetical protein